MANAIPVNSGDKAAADAELEAMKGRRQPAKDRPVSAPPEIMDIAAYEAPKPNEQRVVKLPDGTIREDF